jgi:UDP-N-acetylmuramate dehydrogenase
LQTLLKDILYYRTGGRCRELCEPGSVQALADTVKRLKQERISYIPVGGGTNSLFMDEDYPGAVISFRNLSVLDIGGTKIRVGAGVENTFFSEAVYVAQLAGTGWMNRLPGQIGGTVRMNARCYGGEISQIVSEVTTVSQDGDIRTYNDPAAMFRGYKDTIFMTNGDLIAEVVVKVDRGDMGAVRKKMDFCASDRISKGQFTYPSCGCVFKNNYQVGVSSGILLEEAKAKDLKCGGAEVNPAHANFVFNKQASSRDILELSIMMREAVWNRFGVWLDYEMEILGSIPQDLKEKVAEKRDAAPVEALLQPLRDKMKSAHQSMRPAPEGLNSV